MKGIYWVIIGVAAAVIIGVVLFSMKKKQLARELEEKEAEDFTMPTSMPIRPPKTLTVAEIDAAIA